jgi:predicted GNAT superfamily acetyltransferase
MLAVRTEIRDAGLGWRLKTYQRRVLLERGVRTCYWTFDPLEARNGYLNLGKLGAVSREYVEDMYGDSHSPLHRGLGTDRLVALWRMDSRRVEARLVGLEHPLKMADVAGLPRAFGVDGQPPDLVCPAVIPGEDTLKDPSRFLVPVPTRIQEVRARDAEVAKAWRVATRRAFSRALERGYEVVDLVRDEGPLSYYLLARRANGPDGGAGK